MSANSDRLYAELAEFQYHRSHGGISQIPTAVGAPVTTASVTTTSGAVTLPTNPTKGDLLQTYYEIKNTGSNRVYINSAGTATTSDYVLDPGQPPMYVRLSALNNSINARTDSGTSSLQTKFVYY